MKKRSMVLAPFFFLVAIFFFTEAYSLFESSRKNISHIDIAKWQVKVNSQVLNGSVASFNVDNIEWNNYENVKEGKIAPGVSGHFDIEINPNDTETSIRYDVEFDFSNLDESQFVIDKIEEIDNKEIVRTGKYTYSNIMSLDEIKNKEVNTIRVSLSWINDENNNEKDSLLGSIPNNTLNIPVKVTITQHEDGETLTEYIGE